MKRSKQLILLLILLVLIALLPFILSILMKSNFLYFVSGKIDAWVEFWGSYIGAIIGSIAVFIVAKIQVNQRHAQQVKDIQKESDILYKRAMEGYLLRKKIEKLDQMIQIADQIYDLIRIQEREIYEYIKFELSIDLRTTEKTEDEQENIKELYYRRIMQRKDTIDMHTRKFSTLSHYVPEINEKLDQILELITAFNEQVATVFNDRRKLYEYNEEERSLSYELPIMKDIHEEIPNFIIDQLKLTLYNSLAEVKRISGEWFDLESSS